ncbi:MAG: cyclic nucleotide-binding domain-containing protein [Patescibacteria group bacterium]|nr:cyclic nucleotide-binding domain-containing protein [Patescibacteria group bacterium]
MNEFSILPILQKIPLFANLDESESEELIKNIQLQYYPVDYRLFEQGELGEKMFIIKSGKVLIFTEGKEIATLENNAFFGEMALMGSQPRNAGAKTLEESEIFTLEKKDFDSLLADNPEAAEKIKQAFAERYSKSKLS